MEKLVVVIDDKIPFIKGVFENCADVRYIKGSAINAECVRDADALIVRTRTMCDESLLRGSNVKCVLTATIGYDHIDTEYCEKNNIYWKNAEGCNALAVQQYVVSALSYLCRKQRNNLQNLTLGIVGVGHVGITVKNFADALGIKYLLCDPLKAKIDKSNIYVSLDEIAEKCNAITFHTPLTFDGECPTFHLADKSFLQSLKKSPILINAARGEVFDTQAIIDARKQGLCSALAIDCWEQEPQINRELLALADVATPHIAGYSADGKANATMACISEMIKFFDLKMDMPSYPQLPIPKNQEIDFQCYEQLFCAVYDIAADSATLKQHPEDFEKMRSEYNLRRDFISYSVNPINSSLLKLGFKAKN